MPPHWDRSPTTARTRLLPRQTSGREVTERSDALPQTPHQRRCLPTTARRYQLLKQTEHGKAITGDSESSAARKSLNNGTSERPFPDPTLTLRLDQPVTPRDGQARPNTP